MNRLHLTVLAVSLSAAATFTLGAQPPEGGRVLFRGPSPLFTALDLDQNGIISTEEIARAAESLASLDRNNDGQITPDEISPGPAFARRLVPPDAVRPSHPIVIKVVSPIFKVLDVDGDGVLSADEIANSWKALLDLDANGDGTLTFDEVSPPRPE